MSIRTITRWPLLIAAAVLITAAFISAQGRGGGTAGYEASIQKNKMEVLDGLFTLTKEQNKQVKTLFDDASKSGEPIRLKLATTHEALGAAAVAANAAGLEEAAKAYGAAATEMTELEMKTVAGLHKLLTPEQRKAQAIDRTMTMVRGMFADKKWNVDQKQTTKPY